MGAGLESSASQTNVQLVLLARPSEPPKNCYLEATVDVYPSTSKLPSTNGIGRGCLHYGGIRDGGKGASNGLLCAPVVTAGKTNNQMYCGVSLACSLIYIQGQYVIYKSPH